MFEGAKLVGRERELAAIAASVDAAKGGSGALTFVSGEAGIGKSRLVEEVIARASCSGFSVLKGSCSAHGAQPFQPFSEALGADLFHEEEFVSFAQVLIIDDAGLLVARASPKEAEELDADIFAGMLTAVQNFVKDSFGGGEGSLGRLEYGDLKILLEKVKRAVLVAIFRGAEHAEMRRLAKSTAQRIGEQFGEILADWGGRENLVAPIQREAEALTAARFLVRRSLEGIKLDVERSRISEAVLAEMASRAKASPMLLVVEDVHWSDESSLFVLEYLARNVAAERVAIIATLRREEGTKGSAFADRLVSAGVVSEVRVEPVTEAGVSALLGATMAPNDFPPDFPQRLARDCRGNPFFLTEMLKQMRADGAISLSDGRFSLVSKTVSIPSTIEEMAQRRLEGLDPDAMTMAEYASCIGREFEVSAALSLRTLKDATLAFEKLKAHGIVSAAEGQAQFSHALIQDAIYRNISPRWKGAYHKSLGEHIERTADATAGTAVYDLARHFSHTAEYNKALEYGIKAAEKAESSFAVEQAVSFYESALAALKKARLPSSAEREFELLVRLGTAHEFASDFPRARDAFKRALTLAPGDAERARMWRMIGYNLEKTSEYAESLSAHEAGIKLVPQDSAERWLLEIGRAGTYFRTGKLDECISLLNQVVEKLGALGGHERDIASAYHILGGCHARKGDNREAMANYRRCIGIREKAGDERGLVLTLNNLGIVLKNTGDIDMALEVYSKAVEINSKMGATFNLAANYQNIANIHYGRGDFDLARECNRKALRIFERLSDSQGIGSLMDNLGVICLELGEFDEAEGYNRKGMEVSERIGDKVELALSISNMGEILRRRGDVGASLEWSERALAIAREMDAKDILVDSLIGISEVETFKGNHARAVELCREADGIAEKIGAVAIGNAKQGIAVALWRAGDYAGSEEAFKLAESKFTGSNILLKMPKLRIDWAGMLIARGETARARQMLEEALVLFRSRGLKYWAGRCEKLLARTCDK